MNKSRPLCALVSLSHCVPYHLRTISGLTTGSAWLTDASFPKGENIIYNPFTSTKEYYIRPSAPYIDIDAIGCSSNLLFMSSSGHSGPCQTLHVSSLAQQWQSIFIMCYCCAFIKVVHTRIYWLASFDANVRAADKTKNGMEWLELLAVMAIFFALFWCLNGGCEAY